MVNHVIVLMKFRIFNNKPNFKLILRETILQKHKQELILYEYRIYKKIIILTHICIFYKIDRIIKKIEYCLSFTLAFGWMDSNIWQILSIYYYWFYWVIWLSVNIHDRRLLWYSINYHIGASPFTLKFINFFFVFIFLRWIMFVDKWLF